MNAAIEGAFDAGATEVLVADSHGNAQNIDLELLDKRARLIRAWPRELGMVHGLDRTFAAVGFVGVHATEGQNPGILAHTFSGTIEVSLNGRKVPEGGFSGRPEPSRSEARDLPAIKVLDVGSRRLGVTAPDRSSLD